MNLGKIGDQNVEFFKGHLFFFGPTKSVQPFKSYGQWKARKGKIFYRAKMLERFHSRMLQEALWITPLTNGGCNWVRGKEYQSLTDLQLTDICYLVKKWTEIIGCKIFIWKIVTVAKKKKNGTNASFAYKSSKSWPICLKFLLKLVSDIIKFCWKNW